MEFTQNGYNYRISNGRLDGDRIVSTTVEGDFSEVHFGSRSDGKDLEKICLKIAKDESCNDLLANEAEILEKLEHKSLPVLLDGFEFKDGRCVNVLKEIEDSYDLYTMREHFPDGLDQFHASWVFQRLLSVLGYLHTNNVIHGSIEPGNIMVTPKNHNGLLIDFTLAIQDAHEKCAKYMGTNDYSAPEISKRKKPAPTSDLYSLGRSMVYLLGGEGKDIPRHVDSDFRGFLEKFLTEEPRYRIKDAWKAWHQLNDLRERYLDHTNLWNLK